MRETRIQDQQADKAHRRHPRPQPTRPALRPVPFLIAAALGGAALGVGSTAFGTSDGTDSGAPVLESARPLAASLGLARARPPQAGDHWRNCAQARAAGTAPIYRGEPGYREGMDRDSDGIACEPYHGQ